MLDKTIVHLKGRNGIDIETRATRAQKCKVKVHIAYHRERLRAEKATRLRIHGSRQALRFDVRCIGGVGMLAKGQYDIMAAVLAGEMVPPFVTGLASLIFKNKFTSEQRSNGIANLVIGLAGVTEAAIPYWAADPKAVIISCVAGSGIAGALSEFFECSVMAPFGGFFILPLFEHPFLFLLSLGIGIAVGTVLYGLLAKKPEQPEASTEAENA